MMFIALKIRNKFDQAIIEDDEPFHINAIFYMLGF